MSENFNTLFKNFRLRVKPCAAPESLPLPAAVARHEIRDWASEGGLGVIKGYIKIILWWFYFVIESVARHHKSRCYLRAHIIVFTQSVLQEWSHMYLEAFPTSIWQCSCSRSKCLSVLVMAKSWQTHAMSSTSKRLDRSRAAHAPWKHRTGIVLCGGCAHQLAGP